MHPTARRRPRNGTRSASPREDGPTASCAFDRLVLAVSRLFQQPGGRYIFAGGVNHRIPVTHTLKPRGRHIERTGSSGMASHQQLLYHIVFSTKERRPLLDDRDFCETVWSYMAGTASNLGGHALRIGGYIDHAIYCSAFQPKSPSLILCGNSRQVQASISTSRKKSVGHFIGKMATAHLRLAVRRWMP